MFIHRSAVAAIATVAALTSSFVAHAGGVHHEYRRLGEMFDNGGWAARVLVESTDHEARTVSGTVLQQWSRTEVATPEGPQTFRLPSGPDTRDARETVVYVHYWNDHSSGARPGEEVLLLSSRSGGRWEMLAYTEANVARIELFAAPDFPAGYRAGATVAQLERDLTDYDLYDLAYAELTERGALRHETVLAVAPDMTYLDLVRYHTQQLPPGQLGGFLVVLAGTIPATGYTNHGWRFDQYLADTGYGPAAIPVLLALAAATERREGHDMSLLNRHVEPVNAWLLTPAGAPHAAELAPFVLAWIRVRPSMRCEDATIPAYLDLLRGRDRKQFVDQATALIQTSSCAMGQTDEFLAAALAE